MEKVLTTAINIGEQMLLCGGEVHRVEVSLKRICTALGAVKVDAFIILSLIMVTVVDDNGQSFTQTRQISNIGTDMERLHKLNDLSRRICNEELDLDIINKEFNEILTSKTYPFPLTCLAYSVVSSCFAVFFGGGIKDFIIAFVIGVIIGVIVKILDSFGVNRIFNKFLSSFIASALAFLAVMIGVVSGVDKVMIGVIMTLIPGVGFTNAMRDLFVGDSISGLLRTIEAVLFALSIAAGYVAAAWIFGGVL